MPKWLFYFLFSAIFPVFPQGLISPDLKAYQQVNRIPDATERIRALEQFMSEYPNSPGVDRARGSILDTAIKTWPGQASRLAAIGQTLVRNTKPDNRSHVELLVASKFVDADLLLNESSQLATNALKTSKTAGERAEAQIVLAKVEHKQGKLSNGQFNKVMDEIYTNRYPKTLRVERFHPTNKRTGRIALAELFTSVDCHPCAPVDLAFDAALERFTRSELAVLVYHVHIPTPDPLATSSNDDRRKFYGVRGTPTWAIDGRFETGGGPRSSAGLAWDRIRPDVEDELEKPEDTPLELSVSRNGSQIKAHIKTSSISDAHLHVALVERRVTYSGKNDIRFHPMVVRMRQEFTAGDRDVTFDIAQIAEANRNYLDQYEAAGYEGEPFKFSEKKWEIDPQNLAVIAFVQRLKDNQVLQAAYEDVR